MVDGEQVVGILERSVTAAARIEVLIQALAVRTKYCEIPVAITQVLGEGFTPTLTLFHDCDGRELAANAPTEVALDDFTFVVQLCLVYLTDKDRSVG